MTAEDVKRNCTREYITYEDAIKWSRVERFVSRIENYYNHPEQSRCEIVGDGYINGDGRSFKNGFIDGANAILNMSDEEREYLRDYIEYRVKHSYEEGAYLKDNNLI